MTQSTLCIQDHKKPIRITAWQIGTGEGNNLLIQSLRIQPSGELKFLGAGCITIFLGQCSHNPWLGRGFSLDFEIRKEKTIL